MITALYKGSRGQYFSYATRLCELTASVRQVTLIFKSYRANTGTAVNFNGVLFQRHMEYSILISSQFEHPPDNLPTAAASPAISARSPVCIVQLSDLHLSQYNSTQFSRFGDRLGDLRQVMHQSPGGYPASDSACGRTSQPDISNHYLTCKSEQYSALLASALKIKFNSIRFESVEGTNALNCTCHYFQNNLAVASPSQGLSSCTTELIAISSLVVMHLPGCSLGQSSNL